MNFPEFLVETWRTTAGLLGAIAWPAALVAVAVMFRSEAKNLLGRLKSFSGPGIAADFEDKLEKLEAERSQAGQPSPPAQEDTDGAHQHGEEPTEEESASIPVGPPDVLESVVVRANPVGSVMETWRALDVLLRAVYAKTFPHEKFKRRVTVAEMLSMLHKDGTLPSQIVDMLNELYRMRNIVAHSDKAELSPSQVFRYSRQASDVRRYLERIVP